MKYSSTFWQDLYNGIKDRYPLCCILHYSFVTFFNRNNPHYLGAAMFNHGDGYVYCRLHDWIAARRGVKPSCLACAFAPGIDIQDPKNIRIAMVIGEQGTLIDLTDLNHIIIQGIKMMNRKCKGE